MHLAFGQQSGVSIDSFHVLTANPESVSIELIGSNDGSMGALCLGALAKSKDGLVQSESFPPIILPIGQHLIIPTQVIRPQGTGKLYTDYLYVMVYSCGKETVLKAKLSWQYIWPESPSRTSRNAVVAPDNLVASHPALAIRRNFEDEDYSALDELLGEWNNPKVRDQNGEWKLDSFRSVFLNYSDGTRDWKNDLRRITEWRKFNPKSAGGAIAESKYWIAYAWHIRGCECNVNPDPVAVKVFRKRMKKAEEILIDSKVFASNNPLWYEAYLDIAVATKRKRTFTEKLFVEGIRKHPYFQPLYFEMAKYWSPNYGGRTDWNEINKVVIKAVTLTKEIDGKANYALLYAQIDSIQKLEFDIFQDSSVLWSRMKASFDELIERYPSSDNINDFAAYACRAGDKSTYLNLRVKMKNSYEPNKWPSNYSLDMCDHTFMQST